MKKDSDPSASSRSAHRVFDILDEAATVLDEPCHWMAIERSLHEAADLGRKIVVAVRALLDGVNARYPDKHPREWTCPHMAELDKLVPPETEA
jgi:hypothetical protein